MNMQSIKFCDPIWTKYNLLGSKMQPICKGDLIACRIGVEPIARDIKQVWMNRKILSVNLSISHLYLLMSRGFAGNDFWGNACYKWRDPKNQHKPTSSCAPPRVPPPKDHNVDS